MAPGDADKGSAQIGFRLRDALTVGGGELRTGSR
jgi:hypothetical protein